jgi:5-methylcytosine-specific restriction endonuclease McrA
MSYNDWNMEKPDPTDLALQKLLIHLGLAESDRGRAKVKRGLSAKKRFEVLKRDNFTCRYCGRSVSSEDLPVLKESDDPALDELMVQMKLAKYEVILEVDHVIPRSRGGGDDMDNLVTACKDCNRGKGARPLAEP